MKTQGRDSPETRRARTFLAAIGGVLVAIALWFGAADPGRDYAVSICALLGGAFIWAARFAPDRWVKRCEALLTERS
jgi:hypothetical protein